MGEGKKIKILRFLLAAFPPDQTRQGTTDKQGNTTVLRSSCHTKSNINPSDYLSIVTEDKGKRVDTQGIAQQAVKTRKHSA
jgi:hypothetical protein